MIRPPSLPPVTNGHYPSRPDTISNAPLPWELVEQDVPTNVSEGHEAGNSSSGSALACTRRSCVDTNSASTSTCTIPAAAMKKGGKRSTSSATITGSSKRSHVCTNSTSTYTASVSAATNICTVQKAGKRSTPSTRNSTSSK